ncbi:MAG: hypothetical protein WBG92_00155, partial [Thiohalocapsa sp.]
GVRCSSAAFDYAVVLVVEATEFAPGADWWASDLLELTNTPGGGPGPYPLGFGGRLVVHAVTVDVLGDVLGDVAGGGAAGVVDRLGAESMLCGSGFVGLILEQVVPDGLADGFLRA